jgi:hypothetical protein
MSKTRYARLAGRDLVQPLVPAKAGTQPVSKTHGFPLSRE